MSSFLLPDMTCGHCVATVTKTIQSLDANAQIKISLADHKLEVESQLSAAEMVAALTEAGYPPAA